MSTITLENIATVPATQDEPAGPARTWVTQSPMVALAACATTVFLYLGSRHTV